MRKLLRGMLGMALLVGLTTTMVWSQPATTAPTAELAPPAGQLKFTGKLLAFGDSITACVSHPKGSRWHERLATWSGGKITNVNAGKGGRTTLAMDDLKAALKANPDAGAVLLKLGVNDLKGVASNDATKVAEIVANLGKLVDQVKADLPKAKIVIVAPANIAPDRLTDFWKKLNFGPHTQEMLASLKVEYAKLAKEKGVGFVSAYGSVTEANIPDGIHPNADGQGELGKAIWLGLVGIGF